MAKVLDLQKSLSCVAEHERDVYDRKDRRKFFIEWMSDCSENPAVNSVDTLLEAFTPTEHNSAWQGEFQRIKQNSADLDKMIKDRRAVAYMFSGKQCCYKHYKEDELSLYKSGMARMNWVLNELEQLKMTQDESKPIWIAQE